MQWYRGYFWLGDWKHATTRAKTIEEARVKIESALGHSIIRIVQGTALKHVKVNNLHYIWVK